MKTWTLSPDRRTLTVRIPEPGGTRTVVLGWADPVTNDQVLEALAHPLATPGLRPGQVNTTRRRGVFGGTLWVHSMAGPPTWWVPRCRHTKDGSLLVGWLRRGWALRWDRKRDAL